MPFCKNESINILTPLVFLNANLLLHANLFLGPHLSNIIRYAEIMLLRNSGLKDCETKIGRNAMYLRFHPVYRFKKIKTTNMDVTNVKKILTLKKHSGVRCIASNPGSSKTLISTQN